MTTLVLVGCMTGSLLAANNPAVGGSTSVPGTHYDTNTVPLFLGVIVSDPNNAEVTVSVTLSPGAAGTLSQPAGVARVGNVYTLSQRSPSDATTLLDGLVFTPARNRIEIGSTETATFSISALNTNNLGSGVHDVTVVITPVNDPPTISGASPSNITDKQTVAPFTTVTIADVDNGSAQPVTVTVTLDNTNAASLSNLGGFVPFGSPGTYRLSSVTPATATATIQQLVFSPVENQLPPGTNETITLTISVTDGLLTASDATTTLNLTSVNDPPSISGIPSSVQQVPTGTALLPFPTASITDPDVNTDTNRTGQSQTLQVILTGANLGELVLAGTPLGTNLILANLTPADASAQLQSLVYQAPIFPMPGTNVVGFTVIVTDSSGASATNTATTAQIFTPFTPPGLSGTRAGQHVNDNSVIAPFSTITIQSFNVGLFAVEIRLNDDSHGALVNLGPFVRSVGLPYVYAFTGTSEAATEAIRRLLFQPTANRLDGSTTETTVLGVTLIDGGVTNLPDTSTTVITTPVNDPPVLLGVQGLVTITDNQTIAPFALATITDVDQGGAQLQTVNVSLDDTNKGGFTPQSLLASGFTNDQGHYTLVGTPALVSTAIRLLVFAPTPNRVLVGQTETSTFTITVNDQHGGVVVNSLTQVRVAAINGAPVILVPSDQPVSIPSVPPVRPFSGVAVSDADTLVLTVALDDPAKGSLSNSVASGFTNSAPGTYQFSGSASNATALLHDLIFVANEGYPYTPGAPHEVIFSISALDSLGNLTSVSLDVVLRLSPKVFIVTKTSDYDPDDLTVPLTNKLGTLRKAVEDAGTTDHITFDLRTSTPGLPDYPAIIRLKQTLVLSKGLILDGPGADLLTISGDTDGDGTADVQLFEVDALTVFNRLTMTKGHHPFAGGAIEVKPGAGVRLSYCAVTESSADAWGGAIDVDRGSLVLDHCLIYSNSTSSAIGLGGGGVSIYTAQPCYIDNTTFSGNVQRSPGGLGGGALYVEDFDPGIELDVYITRCTFTGNDDGSGQGTSIRPNVFNTVVQLVNTILADGHGRNLEMDESGLILSLGGNLSDDNTSTIFSFGGAPNQTNILDQPSDWLNQPARLLPLAANGGPTWTHLPDGASPALGNAISNDLAAVLGAEWADDQRGFWRDDNDLDIGAVERSGSHRIIINEIQFDPVSPNDEFLEFYVPRSSGALNLGGFRLYVSGVLRHTFSSQSLAPGQALVLFSKDYNSPGVPTNVLQEVAAQNLQLDNLADAITLQDTHGRTVLAVNYVGSFTSSDTNGLALTTNAHQSIVLSPEFLGAFLPSQRVFRHLSGVDPAPTALATPGYDASGTKPLGGGNASPLAYDDAAATDQNTSITIPVLANDVEFDSTDSIRVVSVTNGPGTVTNIYSQWGALVTICNVPTPGAAVTYDPRPSAALRSLPVGSNVVDTFSYVILDATTNGVDHTRGTGADFTNNLLKATAVVRVSVAGLNAPPTPQPDSIATNPRLQTSEDDVLDFTVADTLLANDTDPDTDDSAATLRFASVHPTSQYEDTLQTYSQMGALVTLGIRYNRNESHITYDPTVSSLLNQLSTNETAVDTFYYTVLDSHGASNSAPVYITVAGRNDPPVANPDSVSADEHTLLVIPAVALLLNDTDVDTDHKGTTLATLRVQSVSPVSTLGASVSLVGANVLYDPRGAPTLRALARGETALDHFDYAITDGFGGLSSNVVSIAVTGVNDAPTPRPDQFSVSEGALAMASAPGALNNDSDPDIHNVIRVIGFTNKVTPAGARVSMNADGSFSYDGRGLFDWLAPGQTAQDTFSYTVVDNSLLIANPDEFSVVANSLSNTLPVLANDALLSGLPGQITILSVSASNVHGTLAVTPAADALVYSPQLNFVGDDTFSYTISDGYGGTDTAIVKVRVTVDSLNGRLTANDDAYTVAYGTTVTLAVLTNDNIPPTLSGSLSVVSVTSPSQGGTNLIGTSGPDNAIAYSPALLTTNTFPYLEAFSYVISGGGSALATGMVTITVVDRRNSLVANDDEFTVLSGSGNNTLEVLANDRILPLSTTNLTITSIQTNGVAGSVSISTNGTQLVYRPAIGLVDYLEPVIQYTISDGAGGTATAAVSIHVVSGGLFANSDGYTVFRGSSNNALTVLLNDAVLPNVGQNLTITAVGTGTHSPNKGGTATIQGSAHSLLYAPNPSFAGAYPYVETFTYEVSDGTIARAQATVNVTVLNHLPVNTNPDIYSVPRDSVSNVLAVLQNDYALPVTPQPLTLVGIFTNGVQGTVSILGSGPNNALVYTAPPGFIGHELFTYQVSDGYGNLGTNMTWVNVGALLTHNDHFTVLTGSSSNALDVLANDLMFPDLLGGRALAGLGAPNQGGAVSLNPARDHALYTPAPGFVGTELFAYSVADDSGRLYSAVATVIVLARGTDRTSTTVTVTINGSNEPPVIQGTVSGQKVYDHGAIQPFAAVTVTDVDDRGQQPVRVTVTLDLSTNGYLTALGAFTDAGSGVYTLGLAGPGVTPASATAALRALTFRPTPGNRVTPGSPETTRFTIRVDDNYAVVADSSTTVTALHPQVGQVVAADRVTYGQFGAAVATTRDLAVVGAPLDFHVNYSGAVHLFARSLDGSNRWQEIRELIPTSPSAGDLFGCTVAISGDTIVIGEPKDSTTAFGSASVFQRNQGGTDHWGLLRRLLPPDGSSGADFGSAVSISGDVIVVGAPSSADRGVSSGSVYVFSRNQGGANQWGFVKKLVPASGLPGNEFGRILSLNGGTLAAGVPKGADHGLNSGFAYVFSQNQGGSNQWGQVAKLFANDEASGDNFGAAVTLDQDTLCIGAPLRNEHGTSSGATYLFARNQGGLNAWGQVQKLVPAEGKAYDRFGAALGVQQDTLVAGAPADTVHGSPGSIYLFTRAPGGSSQWSLLEKLIPATVSPGDAFGSSVALSQGTVAVGAPYGTNSSHLDSVYLFRLSFNNAPAVQNPISDQVIPTNFLFTLIVLTNTFIGSDPSDVLAYSATLADGSPLPAWLNFNPLSMTFSGTPTATSLGTIEVKVLATGNESASVSCAFSITVMGSAYDIWRSRFFAAAELANPALEASLWGDAADPDNDGLSNLQEYIFGTSPIVPGPAAPLTVAAAPGQDPQHIAVTFARRIQDSRLIYTFEISADFVHWQSAQPWVDGSSISPGSSEFEMVTYQIRHPSITPQFLRLRVQ